MFYHMYDASKSWNGYEYQGKVAMKETLLYLEKIIEEKNIKKFEMLENYINNNKIYLEIEENEDFSIIDNDKYISVHQVKTGEGRDAAATLNMFFSCLEKKFGKYFLHYTNEIPITFGIIHKEFKDELDKLLNFNRESCFDNNGEFKLSKKKHSFPLALINMNTSEENLDTNIEFIKEKLKEYKETPIDKSRFVLKKENNSLEIEIKDIIEKIYIRINKNIVVNDIEHKYMNFGKILNDNIEKRSIDKMAEKKINFKKFIDILKKDTLEAPEDYIAYKNHEKIIEVIDKKCNSLIEEQYCDKNNCNSLCRLPIVVHKIKEIDKIQDVMEFVKGLNFPDKIEAIQHQNISSLFNCIRHKNLNFYNNYLYLKEKNECGTIYINDDEIDYKRSFNNNEKYFNELIREKEVILTKYIRINDILGKDSADIFQIKETKFEDYTEPKKLKIETYEEWGKENDRNN
ncbi:ABC-three component system protein [Fusobacterium sp.]|uniref:ABC-three component system protein n=1 Tax=Fusobacterium sp. TaxID=68766 RepID=UPI0029029B2E|nr:ABC-three component system protein [Fusobacterium sp.]MDU1911751.1 ABC-three component system protein [Fusobacterium sp.]